MREDEHAHAILFGPSLAEDADKAIPAPKAGDRIAQMFRAIQSGVDIERAIIGAGLSLGEFADLCDERPQVPAAITRARLDLEVELYGHLRKAAADGKHMAAKALLDRLGRVDKELAEVIVKARTADLGELTPEQVDEQLDGLFSEE